MRYLIILILLVVVYACGSNDASHETAAPAMNGEKQLTTIEWIDSAKQYGKIREGQKLAVSFRFRNSGNKPLIIESVQPSCGCTVADFPREPIAPGAEAEITGEFDSHGRQGLQHKQLIVKANTPVPEQHIFFEVDVVVNKTADQNSTQNLNQ